jgi:hypothetical protein
MNKNHIPIFATADDWLDIVAGVDSKRPLQLVRTGLFDTSRGRIGGESGANRGRIGGESGSDSNFFGGSVSPRRVCRDCVRKSAEPAFAACDAQVSGHEPAIAFEMSAAPRSLPGLSRW